MAIEVTVTSLTEYIDQVVSVKPRENGYGLLPEVLVFRGLKDKEYALVPSLGRRPVERWGNSYLTIESDFVSLAMEKFPDEFANLKLPVAILAKLQHFGIPTRMLDVTSSALVALYFACQESEEKENRDGEVIAFSNIAFPASNVFANMMADTYRLTLSKLTKVENYFYRALKQDYCISEIFPGWEKYLDKISIDFIKHIERPMLVDSFEDSTRQKNQQGKYIIFPNKITDEKEISDREVDTTLVELNKDDPTIVMRLIIPSEKKEEILENLRLLGISEDFLFADNIDIVMKNIKERQTDRYRNT